MPNEAEKNPEQQEQQGSNTSKPDPSQGNRSKSNPQPGTSKTNPSQDSNPQHKDQPQKQAA